MKPDYSHLTSFKHDRKLTARLMKLAKKMGMNNSQVIRKLINEAYERQH